MKPDKRATMKLTREVRDDFMKAKPANITSDQYIRLLLLLWAEKKASVPQMPVTPGPVRIEGDPELVSYGGGIYGPDTDLDRALMAKVTGSCLGRPKGVKDSKPRKRQKDLKPRKRRTKAEMAKAREG